MSGHMGIFGFGEDSPLPTASTVSAENPPDELNYSAAEFRLNNDVEYDTRTGYIEQFPEQEDLSIFGWTNYPDPAVGFGESPKLGPFILGNQRAWLVWAGLTGVGALIGHSMNVKSKNKAAVIGAAVVGVPALALLGFMSAFGGNAMYQLPPPASSTTPAALRTP